MVCGCSHSRYILLRFCLRVVAQQLWSAIPRLGSAYLQDEEETTLPEGGLFIDMLWVVYRTHRTFVTNWWMCNNGTRRPLLGHRLVNGLLSNNYTCSVTIRIRKATQLCQEPTIEAHMVYIGKPHTGNTGRKGRWQCPTVVGNPQPGNQYALRSWWCGEWGAGACICYHTGHGQL